jgi:hypothetical protein
MDHKIILALDKIYEKDNYNIISHHVVGENFLIKILPYGRDYYLWVSVGKYEHKDEYYVWSAIAEDLPLDRP